MSVGMRLKNRRNERGRQPKRPDACRVLSAAQQAAFAAGSVSCVSERAFVGGGAPPEKFAAVVESIAFALIANMEATDFALGPARRIVVTGGLARLDGLCERLATLSGLSVERPENVEATATGLAWLVGGRFFSPAGF